ncbi:PH domain-containing protein [Halogeometricum sp. S1BR25-6]|uniref:PH domain-containing protein n=1 Tax=Halogeometricum salsisoli TaxID=2950536 RepID=A0ABU2GD74_9EURY|nr:PH domain-containing protein [Halogeometricum sp. S1BR25-6]MDS0298771.1 PH domain-containing protein [Halogeometricum sp. S1BR25-6]
MTGPDWVTLDDGETVEWTGRPRLVSAVSPLVVALFLAVGAVALVAFTRLPWVVAAGSLLLVLLVAVAGVYPVYTTAYLVTDRAVYAKRGRRARQVTTLELDKVQDVSYRRSAVGGALGYGTVTVEIAGGGDLSLSAVADARRAADLVGRLARRADDPIPGTVEQWRAVRDELRGIRAVLETQR